MPILYPFLFSIDFLQLAKLIQSEKLIKQITEVE